jgi:hypothetical protein
MVMKETLGSCSARQKRKALLLQKGAATDHILIGRTHMGRISTQIIFLT